MSEVKTLQCDVCKKLRIDDSNHWLRGVILGEAVVIATINGQAGADERYWVNPEQVEHFCGQNCAYKWAADAIGKLWER